MKKAQVVLALNIYKHLYIYKPCSYWTSEMVQGSGVVETFKAVLIMSRELHFTSYVLFMHSPVYFCWQL